MDYSILTDAFSFGQGGPAVVGAAAALISLYVIIKGVELIVVFAGGRAIARQESADELEFMDRRSSGDAHNQLEIGAFEDAGEHRIGISKTSSLSSADFDRLMEEDEQRKAQERGRGRYE